MKRYLIRVNKNFFNYRFPDQQIEFKKIKISQLLHTIENTSNHTVLTLKTDVYDMGITANNSRYFIALVGVKGTKQIYLHKELTDDYEFTSQGTQIIYSINLMIYENEELVSDAHLNNNPLIIELVFIN